MCNNEPQYNGMILSDCLRNDTNLNINLKSEYSQLQDILNKMIRFDPIARPSTQELITVFGRLMNDKKKAQKLLVDTYAFGLDQSIENLRPIRNH